MKRKTGFPGCSTHILSVGSHTWLAGCHAGRYREEKEPAGSTCKGPEAGEQDSVAGEQQAREGRASQGVDFRLTAMAADTGKERDFRKKGGEGKGPGF